MRPRPTLVRAFVRCIGGRSQIDNAAASVIAFGLRQAGLNAENMRNNDVKTAVEVTPLTINLICYASHPSEAVRRYSARKVRGQSKGIARHAVIDYDAAGTHSLANIAVDGMD